MSERCYVLDASAVLCAMLDEPGAEAVAALLPDAKIGAVNLSEVIAKLQERHVPDDLIALSFADLDLEVIAFDREQAERAGRLRLATKSAGLSMGDRACLALAMVSNAIAVTTDRSWARLDVGVDVELVR